MSKYKLNGAGVFDTEFNRSIPNCLDNRHWVRYQEWLAEGNTPDPEFSQEDLDRQAAQAAAQEVEGKIKAEIRKVAIDNLKTRGELDADFEDPKVEVK